jgi:hypothetical protein
VSLDVASTILIKDPKVEGFEPPSRSRCRRLYDIANVLVALGLIRKMHYMFGTKKIPLFAYCGPEPDVNGLMASNELSVLLPDLGKTYTPPMKASPSVSCLHTKISGFVPFHVHNMAPFTVAQSNNTDNHDKPLDLTFAKQHKSTPALVSRKPKSRPVVPQRSATPNENQPPTVMIMKNSQHQVLQPLAIKLTALRTPLAPLNSHNNNVNMANIGASSPKLLVLRRDVDRQPSAFKPIRPNGNVNTSNMTSVGTNAYPYSWLLAQGSNTNMSMLSPQSPQLGKRVATVENAQIKRSRPSPLIASTSHNLMSL